MLLTAIAGSDPADAATAEADKHKIDYAAALDADSLKGKRIGVMRFAAGFGTDAAFETALAVLRERGATLVEIKKFDDSAIGKNEFNVLLDRAQGRPRDLSAGQPGADPDAQPRRRDRLRQGAHGGGNAAVRPGHVRAGREDQGSRPIPPTRRRAKRASAPPAPTASTGC